MDPDMFKYVLFALVVAAPIHVAATDIDMTNITCQELFFEQPPEKKNFNTAVNIQWLSGYYHGEVGLKSIDTEKEQKLAVSVGQHCGLHRQQKVFDVYGRFFREIYQGKRANL
jgi:HdeA/HdeB family